MRLSLPIPDYLASVFPDLAKFPIKQIVQTKASLDDNNSC